MTPASRAQSDAFVVAAAAPLWASVEAAEEMRPFAGSSYSQYRKWTRQLLSEQDRLTGRLHTIALSGEPIRVLADVTAPWVQVELLAQPNGNTGYVGFMNTAHIGPDARRTPTHVVVQSVGHGRSRGSHFVDVPAGTTVELVSCRGGQAEVMLASGVILQCPRQTLRPIGSVPKASELLQFASEFIGAHYLWGGTEAAGIDCSGLVHTAARMGGHTLPRDAHYQWAATSYDADWADLDVGDLIFFGDSATLDGIDHVGIYAGNMHLLHAPEAGRAVTVEPISAKAQKRAVGFGRI